MCLARGQKNGITGEGLEKCRERPVEVKTEIPIVGTNEERRFRVDVPKTPYIGEESPGGACAI